jgi:hypothetical protein
MFIYLLDELEIYKECYIGSKILQDKTESPLFPIHLAQSTVYELEFFSTYYSNLKEQVAVTLNGVTSPTTSTLHNQLFPG